MKVRVLRDGAVNRRPASEGGRSARE